MSRKSHLNWGYLRCRQLYKSPAKSKNEVSVPVTMGLLVGGKTAPLKNMSSLVGMTKFPIYGKITNVPNHQPGLVLYPSIEQSKPFSLGVLINHPSVKYAIFGGSFLGVPAWINFLGNLFSNTGLQLGTFLCMFFRFQVGNLFGKT